MSRIIKVNVTLDLQELAFGFVERLVVGHFVNDVGDIFAENTYQFLVGRLGIFDRVVEDGRAKHYMVGNTALVDEDVGERDRMVDIGRSAFILAPLVAMLVRGKGQRLEDLAGLGER